MGVKRELQHSASGMLSRVRSLGGYGMLMLAAAGVLLPLVDISIRCVGWRRTCRLLGTFIPVSRRKIVTDFSIRCVRDAVHIAATRSPWRTSCLRQAVALWFLLALRGVESEMRIGVAERTESGPDMHAWLERDGIVLIGGETSLVRYWVIV